MAKIVVITSGLTGIVNASFELVARLQAAGHQVVAASPEPVAERYEKQGLPYMQLEAVNFDPAPAVPEFGGPLRKALRYGHKLAKASQRKAAALEALGMDQFTASIRKQNPDLVIIDIELHERIMALYAANIRFVLLSQWFSLWRRKGLPPLSSTIIPGVGKDGASEAIERTWNELATQRQETFDRQRTRSAGTDRRSILLDYAKSVNFPLEYIRENWWPGPMSYDQLPVLAMTMQELEFPHDVRPNLTYVGPMVADSRNEAIDQHLQRAFAAAAGPNRKLIYCSVSTFKAGDEQFLRNVIDACSDQAEWVLVVSLGGLLEGNTFANLPDNVFAFKSVPQLEVLKRANLSINHGGIHTINECVQLGVPMLVYSGKRSDQNGCAARVHFHKIGVMADKDVDSVNDLRDRIAAVLNSDAIRSKLKTTQEKAANYKTNHVLENAVSELLQQPLPASA